VGPKGCFYWGLTNVPENLEKSQPINVISFFVLKTNFHWHMVVQGPFQRQIKKKLIMSFSNLTTSFLFLNN
jgi:hypothetical protein